MNIFEVKHYKDSYDDYKYRISPIEGSKSNSDRVVDLMLYENPYLLNKKVNVFSS